MDTTEVYIKMCEKATQIQALWKRREGDLYSVGGNIYSLPEEGFKGYWTKGYLKGRHPQIWRKAIWLPRQDQLQEMIINQFRNLPTMLQDFMVFALTIGPDTMEQLWLTFVMKERYNKTWDGEDWKA